MGSGSSFDIHPDNFWEAFDNGVFTNAVVESDNARTTLEQVRSSSPFDPKAGDSTVEFGDPEQNIVCVEAGPTENLVTVDPSYSYNFDEFVFDSVDSAKVQLKKIIISSGHGSVAWQNYNKMTCEPRVVRTYTSDEPKEAVDARVADLSRDTRVVNQYQAPRSMGFDYSYLEIQFDAVAKDPTAGMVSCVLRLNPDGHLIAGGLAFVGPQELATSKSEIIAQIRRQVGLPVLVSDEERGAATVSVPTYDYLSRMDVMKEHPIAESKESENKGVLIDEATAEYTRLADALTSAETLAVVEEKGSKTVGAIKLVSEEHERTAYSHITTYIRDINSDCVFNSQVLVSVHRLQREKETIIETGEPYQTETVECDHDPFADENEIGNDCYSVTVDGLRVLDTKEKTETIDDTWAYTFKTPIDVPKRNGTLSTTTSCTWECK